MGPEEVSFFLSQTLAGRYRLDAHIASGGFCGTFRATDADDGSEVAAKLLGLSSAHPDDQREFRDEVSMLRALNHRSHVVRVMDDGTHHFTLRDDITGVPLSLHTEFCILELAAGSLADLILKAPDLDWRDRLRLFRDVIKGIHQMHLSQIVHRDLKADNVLVFEKPAQAKVTDLGRAHDTSQPPRFAADAYLAGRGDLRFAPLEFL